MNRDQADILVTTPAYPIPDSNSGRIQYPIFDEIQTARLDLAPVTLESLHCQQRNSPSMRTELGALLHAEVPDEWPLEHWEPHVYQYLLDRIAEDAEIIGWCRYLLLRSQNGSRTLIGTFGSGLPKPETNEAEIGYGLLPACQRQGFAVEAVEAMLPWIQTRRPVRAFVAQTFPDLRGSIRVLEKTGFHPAGAGFEDGTILFRKEVANSSHPASQASTKHRCDNIAPV